MNTGKTEGSGHVFYLWCLKWTRLVHTCKFVSPNSSCIVWIALAGVILYLFSSICLPVQVLLSLRKSSLCRGHFRLPEKSQVRTYFLIDDKRWWRGVFKLNDESVISVLFFSYLFWLVFYFSILILLAFSMSSSNKNWCLEIFLRF